MPNAKALTELALGAALEGVTAANSRETRKNEASEPKFSSCGDSEGHVDAVACPSQLDGRDCRRLLHELSNVMTGILVHSQLLEWKLPPYCHLKRPLREVARSAERGSALLKRLMRGCGNGRTDAQHIRESAAATAMSEALNEYDSAAEPTNGMTAGPTGLRPETLEPDEAFPDLTRRCDGCTGSNFPKGDDGSNAINHWRRPRLQPTGGGQ